ncbi:hypothetical protein [Flammeovirga sp. SJP92]|uniref:hypothetical protein n=1 Tax=Flammeovirga sp. SJP92 TaxID=1775430 RepID=UPI00078695FA|nr:hypothetical protein [Flammeovirga sp. SJP92]KXX69066.1 hypothetical protein AVL50_18090 [Flammeovirga sp. SJP92]
MNLSVKLILVSLLLSFISSCSSSNDELFAEMERITPPITSAEEALYPSFLNVELKPSGAVCDEDIIVYVELFSSKGDRHSGYVVAKGGVINFSYDNSSFGGAYSVVFTKHNTDTVIGSTSFYITTEDLKKEYYIKTIEYSNCNF